LSPPQGFSRVASNKNRPVNVSLSLFILRAVVERLLGLAPVSTIVPERERKVPGFVGRACRLLHVVVHGMSDGFVKSFLKGSKTSFSRRCVVRRVVRAMISSMSYLLLPCYVCLFVVCWLLREASSLEPRRKKRRRIEGTRSFRASKRISRHHRGHTTSGLGGPARADYHDLFYLGGRWWDTGQQRQISRTPQNEHRDWRRLTN